MSFSSLPPMYRVRQTLEGGELRDVESEVSGALDALSALDGVWPGMRIAVTAGSRGIDRIVEVLRAVVAGLRQRGADPFLVAAMGSHGGATAAGQLQVLARLGITPDSVGAPVHAGAKTVVVGVLDGLPLHCSETAARADGIVLVNRVHPHTSYQGAYESGLVKMLAVGLGQEAGASLFHGRGVGGLARQVPAMAEVMLRRLPVLFGVALIENGFHRLRRIEAVPAGDILEREPVLLEEARRLRPALPFREAHVLVVERMGKDLSGTGMDTQVVGRLGLAGETDPMEPRVRRIVVLRLSERSGGSAYGIGLADVTTLAVIRAMDPDVTRSNALASTFVERARMPLAFASDREAIFAAAATCGYPEPGTLRMARIRDTLSLSELWVSGSLLEGRSREVEVVEGPVPWPFDEEGNLPLVV